MKKAVKIIVSLVLVICAFSIRAVAAERTADEYILTQRGERYTLTVYESGEPRELASGGLSDVLSELPEGHIRVDGVSVSESFDFPRGDYTLSGSLLLKGGAVMSVPSGTSLTLSGFTLSVESGSNGLLRIKGGSILMKESFVFGSSAGAVVLDYSSDSRLTLVSTGISSVSQNAAVTVLQGNLYLSGGYVKNEASAAISSDAGIYLSGTPELSGVGYDIVTEKPIHLSSDGVGYSGNELKVKYQATFSEGTMSEIFYGTSAEATSRIRLYDESGREQLLTYFDSCSHTAERCFAAVYLPYTVKIKDGTRTVSTIYKLDGELMAEPHPEEKCGYSFVGWYRDAAGSRRYDFSTPISASVEIYAIYSLTAPTFSISSLVFTYDGLEHRLSFDSLSHPLDGQGGFYSYKWYKDGEQISTAASISVKNVSDSGSYSCTVTYNFSSDTSQISVSGIAVSVECRTVTPEKITPLYYNGREQTPSLAPSSLYTAQATSGVSAGKYKVVYTLNDKENCRFAGSDGGVLEAEYEILRAENSWIEQFSVSDVYVGGSVAFIGTSAFGSVELLFSSTENGAYTSVQPTAAGSYYVRASVAGTENYTSLLSAPLRFSVLAERVIDISVVECPEVLRYVALSGFSPIGLTLRATYDSGRVETVASDRISYSYQNGSTFRFGDTAVNLSFGGVSLALAVEVVRADYDMSGFEFTSDVVSYDGSYRTISYSGNAPVGLDGTMLGASVMGGGTEVGSYKVTLTFSTESPDYNTPADMEATLTIEPACVTLEWSSLSFVYDGTAKAPIASYVDVFGVLRYPQISGGAASAGEYTAVASEDKNYRFENPRVDFKIERADYDFAGVYWIGGGYVYDGTEKSVTVAGLPSGVSAIGYTDSKAKNAGSYLATAALSYDSKNYNPPPTLTHEWSIAQGEYDTSGFSFGNTTAVFDGRAHYPSLVGSMPVGADGVTLEYEISRGVTHVSDSGDVVISFYTSSKNYKAPNIAIYTVTVLPKEITVVWEQSSHVYDGRDYAPSAFSDICSVTVNGGGINAGEHIAYAMADNTDYKITNDRITFVISKAQNSWLAELSVSDIFVGQSPSPEANAAHGLAEYLYFADEALSIAADPAVPGVYYAVARVPESGNFLPLESEAVAFSVIEVVAVALDVSVIGSVVAFTPIDVSVLISAKYNDGSERTLSLDEVEIEYQSADSPRVGDDYIILRWADFEERVSVTVSKGKYDMSQAHWENTTAVFDGTEKFVSLTGLPDGVSVREYVGNGAVNAGEYTVVAHLDYDTVNFEAPELQMTVLIVSKMQIALPVLHPIVYDGGRHVPELDSPYCTLDFSGATNAGEYTVTARIIDAANYCFEGGSESADITFYILPRELTVRVDGIRVYRDGEMPEAGFSIVDGSVVEGDRLNFVQTVSDGKVVLTLDNGNYILTSIGGEIEHVDRLSPEAERKIVLRVVLAVLIAVMLVSAVLMRGRIATLIAVLKCRYVNRRQAEPAQSPVEPTVGARDVKSAVIPPIPTSSVAERTRKMPPLPISLIREQPAPTDSVGETDTETEEATPDTDIDVQDILPEEDTLAEDIATDEGDEIPSESDETSDEEETVSASIDVLRADALITDSLAKDLVQRGREIIYTDGNGHSIINVDTLSRSFEPGDRVDVNILKKKSLIPYDTAYLKVLARGAIDGLIYSVLPL